MGRGFKMHDLWNTLLLCVLLVSVPWAEGQAESPESAPAIDEESEIVGPSPPDASVLPSSEGYGIVISMPSARASHFSLLSEICACRVTSVRKMGATTDRPSKRGHSSRRAFDSRLGVACVRCGHLLPTGVSIPRDNWLSASRLRLQMEIRSVLNPGEMADNRTQIIDTAMITCLSRSMIQNTHVSAGD